MTAPFVELVAVREKPFNRLVMRAPVDQADQAWKILKAELPEGYVFTATPVDDLDLRSESGPA